MQFQPTTVETEHNPLFATLNEAQKKAVSTIEGPLLVLAGAGTGKTKVLTSRVAYLMQRGVFPGQLLVVTFTNKAAKEMKERIQSMAGIPVEGLWLGTFHAMATRILRKHASQVGLQQDFTIIDSDDQMRILKQLIGESGLDEKKSPAKQLAFIINRWKDLGLTPKQITPNQRVDFADGRAVEFYQRYQERLLSLNAADFGDLLLHNLTLFMQFPDILQQYHHRFRYILVDEYQDTNIAQYLWLRLLAQAHHNICCVGDDDQSIYGWRGAEVGNILKFEKDFKNANIIRLERNYRSTSHILGAASGLIACNQGRLGKTLWTEDNEGQPVRIWSFWDDLEEANAIADEIESLTYSKQVQLNQTAILVRAGFQTRTFEECFISRAMPYKVIGGLRFYERLEIKDIIAYLRLVHQPYDLLAFERIANTPKRGVGPANLQLMIQTSRGFNLPIFETIEKLIVEQQLPAKTRTSMLLLCEQMRQWREAKHSLALPELAQQIIHDTGYLKMWQQDKSVESEGRVENIKELVNALADFESLETFLDHVSLVMDVEKDEKTNMIPIMTLHAAKGLEFDTVFLPGWEHGLFPHQRSLDDQGTNGLEEERRLAYVGITRAKRKAYISFASRRRMYGRYQHNIPSRFISELPEEHTENATPHSKAFINDDSGIETYETRVKPQSIVSKWSQQANLEPSQPKLDQKDGYRLGGRVFHIKFGYGKILQIDGNKLEIIFETAGRKTVIDSFVTAA